MKEAKHPKSGHLAVSLANVAGRRTAALLEDIAAGRHKVSDKTRSHDLAVRAVDYVRTGRRMIAVVENAAIMRELEAAERLAIKKAARPESPTTRQSPRRA